MQVYQVLANAKPCPLVRLTRYEGAVVNYSKFTYTGAPLVIEVIASEPFKAVMLSPQRLNFGLIVSGNRLSFTVEEPQYFVLRSDGLEDLFILIDSPQSCPADAVDVTAFAGVDKTGKENSGSAINQALEKLSLSGKPETLYFPAGTYLTGQLTFPSNLSLFLDEEAAILAYPSAGFYPNGSLFYFENVHDSSIRGLGTIDGSGRALRPQGDIKLIKAVNCERLTIDGPTEVDSAFWANHIQRSQQVHFQNIKIINYRPERGMNNTDGLNFDSSENCSLTNGFFCTGDDNCTVKGTLDGAASSCITFRHYLGYSNSAACKIGTETVNRSISDIIFEDIDVVSCDRALVICGFDSAKIEKITFSDIHVEKIVPQGFGAETSRFIDFQISDKTWRPCLGACQVEAVTCRNIDLIQDSETFPSRIEGRTAQYHFKGLVFEAVRVGNRTISKAEEAAISVNQWVENMKFLPKNDKTS